MNPTPCTCIDERPACLCDSRNYPAPEPTQRWSLVPICHFCGLPEDHHPMRHPFTPAMPCM